MPLPADVAAVFFDAGGTLIHAEPSPRNARRAASVKFRRRASAATIGPN